MEVYVLAVFRSRTQSTFFERILQSYNIPCSIVNTPDQLKVGCSVAVKISTSQLTNVIKIFSRRKFDSFVGFYKIVKADGRIAVMPITSR